MNQMLLPTTVSRLDLVSWSIMAVALVLIIELHLLPALFAGLLVYQLVAVLTPLIRRREISSDLAKVIIVAGIAGLVIAGVTFAILGAFSFFRSDSGNLSVLLQKLAEIIEQSRDQLPAWVMASLPESAEEMRASLVQWLRGHADVLQGAGKEFARVLAHVLIGMVIGALLSLREASPTSGHRPLAASLGERCARLANSFRQVVFAQVWIAACNALLTGVYLVVALPLFGVQLPLAKTLVAVTFVCGLLPVIGNLVSNTIIVIVSLSNSLFVAVASLAYLIVIHKLEYFLNARIIGSRIRAKAWEMLVAMLFMEAAFGLAGLIAAPIYYAYLKNELEEKGLV